jgi:hypothetical protein
MLNHMPKSPLADQLSALSLLAVNLIPVACVILFHWDVTRLMLFYCAENVVIGVYNVAKMISAGFAHGRTGVFSAIFYVPIFIMHYGLFCLGHGFLILTMGAIYAQGGQFPIPLSVVYEPLFRAQNGFSASLASMVLFHGMAFVFGWLAKGQAHRTTPGDLMFASYGRIGVLHLTLLGGMAMVLVFRQPLGAVAMLGVAKTVLELAQRKHSGVRDAGGLERDV